MAILAPEPLGQKFLGPDPLGPIVITPRAPGSGPSRGVRQPLGSPRALSPEEIQRRAAARVTITQKIGEPNGFLGEDPGANLNLGPKPVTKVPTAVPKPVPKPPVAKLPPAVIPKVPKLPPLPPLPPPTLPPSVAPSAAGGGGAAAGGGIILLIGLALLASFGKR